MAKFGDKFLGVKRKKSPILFWLLIAGMGYVAFALVLFYSGG